MEKSLARKIIGISGFIGSGKGTVSDILVEEYNFTKISFADRLKDTVAIIFDWPRDLIEGQDPDSRAWREHPDPWWSEELGYNFSPRMAMQRVGTDCLRKGLDDNIWVLTVKKILQENPETDFVIPDIRFYNERDLIRAMGGEMWRVKQGNDPDWTHKAISDNRYDTTWMKEHPEIHESEWRWMDYATEFNRIIPNDDDLAALKEQVYQAMRT